MQEVTAEILIERVWAYCEKILSGEIKACQKHKWAVQRFFKDVEALADPDCPFYYDAEAVLDFYEWARQFRHVEGILAGEPIELTDFQLFIAANVYGFFKKENGARRFRKVYIQLARKNAKSQFLALMASYEVFPTTEKHRVFIAGWSREQSDEVYQAILEQLQHAPILEGKYTSANGRVKKYKTNSIIQPLSREARKLGDGKNPSLGIVDKLFVA
ncbi:terminase large subunit domain-containing protein [Bacillus paralicheniformis]|uniref:terminase large subunit domain-containing protein n=1 Tax=Bacillus TaxID=1386 RepID=UPI001E5E0F76|nr:terminase large subunit [Bacillus paralicheniformis]UZN54091.1 terminase large subunit [Bacillus paralicheniformis]